MKTSQNRFDQFWLFSVDFENFIIPVYQICLPLFSSFLSIRTKVKNKFFTFKAIRPFFWYNSIGDTYVRYYEWNKM